MLCVRDVYCVLYKTFRIIIYDRSLTILQCRERRRKKKRLNAVGMHLTFHVDCERKHVFRSLIDLNVFRFRTKRITYCAYIVVSFLFLRLWIVFRVSRVITTRVNGSGNELLHLVGTVSPFLDSFLNKEQFNLKTTTTRTVEIVDGVGRFERGKFVRKTRRTIFTEHRFDRFVVCF